MVFSCESFEVVSEPVQYDLFNNVPIAYGNSSTFWFIIIMGAIKGVAASAFMELGICALGLPAGIVCWIGMTLMGTAVAQFGAKAGYREKVRGESRRIDFED